MIIGDSLKLRTADRELPIAYYFLPIALSLIHFVALIYIAFGVMTFSRSHNPHHLGTLVMGVLLGSALAIPRGAEP